MPAGATAAASAAASLGSGALSASAANDASKSQQNAAAQNLAFQNQVYSQAQQNLNPYANTGQQANQALSGLLGTGGNPAVSNQAFQNYLNSTNYKFQLGQGLQGIEYANAPAFNSGATGKALNNYAQGQAAGAINNYETMLQGQSGLGLQAGSALNGVGVGIGAQNAAATNNAANAQGNAAYQTANSWNNALSGLGKAASSYMGNSGGLTNVNPYQNALGPQTIVNSSAPEFAGGLNTTLPTFNF